MARTGIFLVLLVLVVAPLSWAGQLRLKDGNVLNGDFERMVGGSIVFKTKSMGEMTIPGDKIAGFTSGSAVVIILKDGTRPQGTFSITESGAWQLESEKGTTTLRPSDVLAVYPSGFYKKENPTGTRRPWQDWNGQGTLGYVLQQSSQDAKSLSIGFTAARIEPTLPGMPPRRATHFSLNLADATVTQSGVTTKANTLTSVLRQDFFIGGSSNNYLFLQGEWDHLQPQDLTLRQTYGGGIGRRLVQRPHFNFAVQGGLTYVRTKFDTGELRNEMEALAGENITWTIMNHLNIAHEFDVYPSLTSAGDYRFNSLTALNAPISKRFSFNISLNDQFLSRPVPGTEQNILILSTGLGISF
jgi:putative salt-induced outer membrane protein YdiY